MSLLWVVRTFIFIYLWKLIAFSLEGIEQAQGEVDEAKEKERMTDKEETKNSTWTLIKLEQRN